MYNTGGTCYTLYWTKCDGEKVFYTNALTPVTSNHPRYKQSPVRNYIPDRLWKKFNNIRLAPLATIRNKVRQKNIDSGSHCGTGKSDGV